MAFADRRQIQYGDDSRHSKTSNKQSRGALNYASAFGSVDLLEHCIDIFSRVIIATQRQCLHDEAAMSSAYALYRITWLTRSAK
jgi:hypothetical protein